MDAVPNRPQRWGLRPQKYPDSSGGQSYEKSSIGLRSKCGRTMHTIEGFRWESVPLPFLGFWKLHSSPGPFVHLLRASRVVSCSNFHCWLLLFLKYPLIYFSTRLALHCRARAFSSHSESGYFSSCCAQASHCGGVSYCRAQAVGHAGYSSCRSRAPEVSGCGAPA